jgi:rod shape-determining protein MreC
VITPDGIVGKVIRADSSTSQVLLISDQSSGAGVLFERLRLKGILKGTPSGRLEVMSVMADEEIKPGDSIVTSGGDGVFPKGLPVGTVQRVFPDQERDPFLSIEVKPAVNLGRLEEVLVITDMSRQTPEVDTSNGTLRAADLLAQRLPSVKKQEQTDKKTADPALADPERGAVEAPEASAPSAPAAAAEKSKSPSQSPASDAGTRAKTGSRNPGAIGPKPKQPSSTAPAIPPKSTTKPKQSSNPGVQPTEGSTPR